MPRLSDVASELLAPIQGIVFDKDGTLADLEKRWIPFFRDIIRTTAAHGSDPEAETTLAAALGVGIDRLKPGSPAATKSEGELLAIAVGHLTDRGWTADDALAALGAAVDSAEFGPLAPLGNVHGAIAALSIRYKLGIATSDNRANTVAELAELGIGDYITAMHCGDDGDAVKPEPEVLWGLARRLNVEPHRLVFVGDSTQDMATAEAAGTPFVAVDPGQSDQPRSAAAAGADAWILSIEEIAGETAGR